MDESSMRRGHDSQVSQTPIQPRRSCHQPVSTSKAHRGLLKPGARLQDAVRQDHRLPGEIDRPCAPGFGGVTGAIRSAPLDGQRARGQRAACCSAHYDS